MMKRYYNSPFYIMGFLLIAAAICPVSSKAQTAQSILDNQQRLPLLKTHEFQKTHSKSNQDDSHLLEQSSNYWTHYTPQNTGTNQLSGTSFGPIYEDDQNRLWVSQGNGTIAVQGVGWSILPEEGMNLNIPSSITAISQPKTIYYSNQLDYYLGSSSGLVKIDAQSFNSQVYDTTNSDIKRNDVNDIHFSGNTLWIAHGNQVIYRYQEPDTLIYGGVTMSSSDNSFQPIPDNSIKGNVLEIAESSSGNIWFAVGPDTSDSNAGVYKYDASNDTWSHMNESNSGLTSNLVTGVMVDQSDNLWVGLRDTTDANSEDILAMYDGSNWTTWSSGSTLQGNIITELLNRGNGDIWVSTNKGTYSYDGSNWAAVTTSDPNLKLENVNYAMQRRNGDIVVGTYTDQLIPGGVGTYSNNSWSYLSPQTDHGVNSNVIFASARDDQGNMWFSGFNGLIKYDGQSWTNYNRTDGMHSSYAWSMLYDSQGKLWLGTSDDENGNGAITVYENGNFTTMPTSPDYGPFFGEDIFEDSQGNIWFGSFNLDNQDGVLMYDGSSFTHFGPNDGCLGNGFQTIGELPNGNIVVANYGYDAGNGTKYLYQYDGSSWSPFMIDGNNTYISNIQVDNDGNTWFAGNSNLYKWDGSNWTTYDSNDGYLGAVNEMALTSSGDLWIASYNGLQVFSNGSFHTFSTSQFFGNAYTTYVGSDDAVWFGSYNYGIARYDVAKDITITSINDLPDDEGGRVQIKADGFLLDPFRVDMQDSEVASWNVWRKDGDNWISVGSSPVNRAETNLIDVQVPTTAESGNVQAEDEYTFRISAHRNDGSIIAYSDTVVGHAIDNRAPAKVTGVSKTDQSSGVTLSWDPVDADDLEEYAVYLLNNDGSIPDNALKTSTSNSVDISGASSDREFVVKAKDRHNNYGKASDPVTVTDIDKGRQLPDHFTLEKNYPNPFNPTTSIPFALPEASKVTINVYNILGSKVATLTNKRYSAGEHQVSFKANGLASGTYIIRARMGKEVFERKIMLLK